MDSLKDYIQWMGDFPISMTGFRDADALVLCALSYIDFSPVFSEEMGTSYIRDCLTMVKNDQVKVMTTGGSEGYPELLAAAASSIRFGSLSMTDYLDLSRKDPPLQFAAVCFHDDADFSFLAYRGTDNSLAGWKEDFMISFTRTRAQKLALAYARDHINGNRHWYMGGHSKGSNLALYAACLLDRTRWDTVDRLYLLDGPGLCPQVLDPTLYRRINAKTTQIVPRFCIIGKLFAPDIKDTRIIQSSLSGFLQHIVISWGIDHGKPALTDRHDSASRIAAEAVNDWISSISPPDRAVFVDDLFEILSAGGADTLDQIRSNGLEGLEAIFRRLRDSRRMTRKSLSDLQLRVLKANLDNMLDRLSALRRQKTPGET